MFSLQTESGKLLLKHFGTEAILKEIKQIRTLIKPKYFKFVDDIITFIDDLSEAANSAVPPLQSELPLSYRSYENTYESQGSQELVETTASSFQGFVQQNSSLEQKTG